MQYWTQKEQQLIHRYYWAYTAATSAVTRNECFTELLPALTQLTKQALFSTGIQKYTEDDVQDCLMRMHAKLLPRLSADKLQGCLNYLWFSTKNYIITFIIEKRQRQITTDELQHEEIGSRIYEADNDIIADDTRVQIIAELDRKIKRQKILNKTNTIFLILMKEYILQNDFDARGFEQYIQEKMQISKTTYQSIMSRVGIRSKLFNEKLS